MKKSIFYLLPITLLFSCSSQEESDTDSPTQDSTIVENIEEPVEENKKLKSPRLESSGVVDGVEVDLDFGSPSVKERVIWGDLVPYDEVWRAGANEATALTFGSAVLIDGSEVPAGTYALFIIPRADKDWTVVLNEEWSQEEHGVWGAFDYKEDKDVLRFDVTPTFKDVSLEMMMFNVTDNGVSFDWEYASFEFAINLVG